MERTMSVEDKIRRAEEIYYRRRKQEIPNFKGSFRRKICRLPRFARMAWRCRHSQCKPRFTNAESPTQRQCSRRLLHTLLCRQRTTVVATRRRCTNGFSPKQKSRCLQRRVIWKHNRWSPRKIRIWTSLFQEGKLNFTGRIFCAPQRRSCSHWSKSRQ